MQHKNAILCHQTTLQKEQRFAKFFTECLKSRHQSCARAEQQFFLTNG